MNSLQEKINSLKGTKITSFQFEFSINGFEKQTSIVNIDKHRNNVSPATGCDIIIHGASCKSSRILSINPNLIEEYTTLIAYTATNIPSIKIKGFCHESDVNMLFTQFKSKSKVLLSEYKKKIDKVSIVIDAYL